MTTTAPGPRSGPLTHADGREVHKGMALLVLAISQLMVVLDATIVNVALPDIARDLDITSQNDLSWIVTGYTLTFGGFLLLAAWQSDPNEARGLGGALLAIRAQPFRRFVFGVVALGLIAFGAFGFAEAAFRRIDAPGEAEIRKAARSGLR